MAFWIGYTMIVTPEPLRMNYEEAYEEALNIPENEENNSSENKEERS